MTGTLIAIGIAIVLLAVWIKSRRDKRKFAQHTISPEDLQTLLASDRELLIFDVRQPLDLLAESEIIPGAMRLDPKDVIENPTLIPKDKDTVVYCTCPSDETSLSILQRALALGFSRVKFLRGGLAAWKAKGYRVEPYEKSFHLDPRP
jgi:rhodanese-related sulfurtransferase